ncbi:unnamed protein product [Lactuca saligna]|uniref:Uncharacterized protein n=1 Tax=Lactuca saligna TaxID=75948 RepID=A0AA35YY84_LACSI|nr:unnamed protein product [Lactuca saligna]
MILKKDVIVGVIEKRIKIIEKGFRAHGNSASENVLYCSLADCRDLSSPSASQANSSATPGPAVNLPTVAATVQVYVVVPLAATEEWQAAPAASPNLTTIPVVNSENSSVHIANSGSLKNGTNTSNKQAPVGLSCGYIRMSGIPSTNDSLSHPLSFSNMIHGENDVFS